MAAWKKLACLSTAVLLSAFAMPVMGQAAPGGADAPPANNGGGGGGGGGGGRGNFDPAAMRQRMLDRLKTELGATDEEMTALTPKIEAVMTARREVMGNMFGGNRRGRGPDNADAAQPAPTPLQQARKDLQEALDNKDSTADQIKVKLDAFRAAKKTASEALVKAQADLKSVLTQRQEAVLVVNGMLD